MSRDWTPSILFAVDKYYNNRLRNSNIVMCCVQNGKEVEIPLTNSEARGKYPELSFLFDDFKAIYEEYKNKPEACKVMDVFEKALRKVECEEQCTSDKKIFFDEIDSEPIEDVVNEWFYGRLDSGFYHSTYNNQIFREYFTTKIGNAIHLEIEQEIEHD